MSLLFLAQQTASAQVISDMLHQFENASHTWQDTILQEATYLFYAFSVISLILSIGIPLVFRLDPIFLVASLAQWLILNGVAYWGMTHGTEFCHNIINSFYQLAGQASGQGDNLKPTVFLDLALQLYQKIVAQERLYDPGGAVAAELSGLVILGAAAWTTCNLVEVLAGSWLFAAIGPLFASFGALVWTRDVAINFYRSALAIGAKVMVMVLLMSVGISFLTTVVARMGQNPGGLELGVYIIGAVFLAFLSQRLPNMAAGVFGVSGGSALGNWGIISGLAVGGFMGQAILRASQLAVKAGKAADAGLSSVEKAANHADNLRARGVRPTRNGSPRP